MELCIIFFLKSNLYEKKRWTNFNYISSPKNKSNRVNARYGGSFSELEL